MGFMDKAKKLAEQAQTKLDEVQQQFNESQGSSPQQPSGDDDQHGRPIRSEPPPEPAPPPAEAATPPHGDPVSPSEPSGEEDRNNPSYAPPKLTGGDPLAG